MANKPSKKSLDAPAKPNSAASSASFPSSDKSLTSTIPPPAPSDASATAPVKVNNANITELKNACDDVVRELFGRPTAFTRSYVHEDVRLVLGWSASLIAFGTAYYGYVVPFQESKGWVTVGVALYAILSGALALYVAYVEKSIILTGKRRTFAARISTEVLTVSSTATPSPRSAPLFPFLSFLSSAAAKPPTVPYPSYTLTVSYVHSSNGGKSLIHQSERKMEKCFGEFFDGEGTLWREGLEKELETLLVGVVGE